MMNKSKLSDKDSYKFASLVIYCSETEEGPWKLVKPEDVPDWLKNDPVCVGHLMRGEMAQKDNTGLWYRAEQAHPNQTGVTH